MPPLIPTPPKDLKLMDTLQSNSSPPTVKAMNVSSITVAAEMLAQWVPGPKNKEIKITQLDSLN